jgi:hypothetical protein
VTALSDPAYQDRIVAAWPRPSNNGSATGGNNRDLPRAAHPVLDSPGQLGADGGGLAAHARAGLDRLLASAETMPLNPPAGRPVQSVTMMIANDMDGSLQPATQNLALPVDANARAHVILQHLIVNYARPNSKHPIAANKGVNEIFFMTLPLDANHVIPGTEAIVDLSGSFVEAHPSGIEPETLTLLSIIGTLHANFPQISQVRFLVDGQQRDTLAGHADLTRVYLASDSPGSEAPVTAGRLKIGVFDSGFGGLTVLRALLPLLPQAEFLYLGDTARLPYGSKSRATIVRYALSSTRFLLDQGADFLVIACNTATALALKEIHDRPRCRFWA